MFIWIFWNLRCNLTNEDPFRACFGCSNEIDRSSYEHFIYQTNIDRQTGEMFQATKQSRRVICGTGPQGKQRCRLRIDRAMQFRRVSYGRAIQFIQSEQYLSNDDVDIVRYKWILKIHLIFFNMSLIIIWYYLQKVIQKIFWYCHMPIHKDID